jgi:hypothetical protein
MSQATDANAVLDRLAVAQDVVEPALTGRDHDCARRLAATPRYHLPHTV